MVQRADEATGVTAPPGAGRPARESRAARRIVVEGVVQGVGFRPFVWRLATELGVTGRVRNAAGRVEIEAAGPVVALDAFASRLRAEAPPRARVERVVSEPVTHEVAARIPPAGGSPAPGFTIEESLATGGADRLFPPDLATCDDCLAEMRDPADRRYRYPFINCTNCGPRATIIDDLPYDRAATTMRAFPLCPACAAEYADPANRRFHAEPVACPDCGPRVSYRRASSGAPSARDEVALVRAAFDLVDGRVVAVKGLGGYHLACDATNQAAVARLRERKRRWAKPFAVMVADVDAARRLALVSPEEAALLTSPARPIVLLEARNDDGAPGLAPSVAVGNPRLGLFLPYTPLHHLLLESVRRPIVLTSGNLSDEPLATSDEDAARRLAGLADAFLSHDRVICARYDDSVTRVVAGRESIIRRARGYAPEPMPLPVAAVRPLLAVGAELKHTFTLARGTRAHIAPHNGDLEDLPTHTAFTEGLAHLSRLLALEPKVVVHDLHPEYLSTKYALARFPGERRVAVQHHHAHVASCAAEHGVTGPFIGVAYDGLGMGDDGTFWGGEVFVADLAGYRRVARFGRAPMPGGSLAVRRPYRMALGYLLGAEAFAPASLISPPTRPDREHPDVSRTPGVRELTGSSRSAGGGGGAGRGATAGRGEGVDPDLVEAFVERLDPREVEVVRTQVTRGLNAPVASSAGRLFDAVASLLGLRDVAEYEAQAAIDLEIAAGSRPASALPYAVDRVGGLLVYDPRPTLAAVLEGVDAGRAAGDLAAAFHETVVEVTREIVAGVREALAAESDPRTRAAGGVVCLSGGVMQNRRLATSLVDRLGADGVEVYVNHLVPCNDGGISYGQAAVAAARMAATGPRPAGPSAPGTRG